MRRLDRGDHRDMRLRKLRQRCDLARVVHADLGNAERGIGRQTCQRQRQSPMIVIRRDRRMRVPERRQDLPQHLLRRGLPDASGDRDKLPGEAMPRITTQPMQPGQRVVHQQQMPRIRHIAVHHRTGRALRHRVGDEGMPIPGLAAQSDEQIIRLQAARIDRDATGGERSFPSLHRWPPADRAGSKARSRRLTLDLRRGPFA